MAPKRKLDSYPDMGTRIKLHSLDDCLLEVRKRYPECWMEGSAGLQRMFMVMVEDRKLMVGHAWSSGRVNSDFNYTWYVRVAPEPRVW